MNYLEDGFDGIFSWDYDIPEGCCEFILSEMERHGLETTPSLYHLAIFGARTALFHFSHFDPYVFFARGLSDVKLTDDWQNYSYQLRKEVARGKIIYYEPHAEEIESYSLALDEGERVFQTFLSRPMLAYDEALDGTGKGHLGKGPDGGPLWITTKEAHPLHDIAVALQDTIQSELSGMEYSTFLTRQGEHDLRSICTRRNTHTGVMIVDLQKLEYYFEFAAWAAMVWFLSPLSRDWRCENNALMRMVHEYGEAILVGYTPFPRDYYVKESRPLRSCHRCHVQSWCLEDVMQGDTLSLICESCLSDGMPILPPANCGSKLCRMPQCRHHPLFAFDPNLRLHQTMRTAGQLVQNQTQNPLLAGSTPDRRLLR